jgi:hypothetical protein
MILLHLQGRLGNQLFQVFTVIAAAMETNQSFGFYSTAQNTTTTDLYWDTVFPHLKSHLFYKPIKVKFSYSEKEFIYKPFSHLLQPYRGVVCQINGYFQKIKYFEHLFYDIVKLLHLNEIRQQVYNRITFEPVNWSLTVCMHFRIGDYAQHQNILPLMPFKYYLNALTAIVNQFPKVTTVMYFCEKGDVDKVQPKVLDLFIVFPHLTFQKVPDGLQDYEEMFVMSFCQHHIIANSTFSYWGALLQDSSAPRMVCYPSLWFGPSVPDTFYNLDNTFPETWTQIPVSA